MSESQEQMDHYSDDMGADSVQQDKGTEPVSQMLQERYNVGNVNDFSNTHQFQPPYGHLPTSNSTWCNDSWNSQGGYGTPKVPPPPPLSWKSRKPSATLSRQGQPVEETFAASQDSHRLSSGNMDYYQRIDLAYASLGIPRKVEDSCQSDTRQAELSRYSHKNRPLFPMTKSVQRHFEEAWEGFIGADSESQNSILNPPQGIPKVGKRSYAKRQPFYKWYRVDPESHKGWPLKCPQIDQDAIEIGLTNKKNDTVSWMDMNGKVISILNQITFFSEACKVIIDSGLKDCVREDGSQRFNELVEFLDTRARSLEDATNIATNLQVNLLLARRAEIASGQLSETEVNALRCVPPTDPQNRIFSGKIQEFKSERPPQEEPAPKKQKVQSVQQAPRRFWKKKNRGRGRGFFQQ